MMFAGFFADFENLADVRMIDRGHGQRLAPQALARVRVSRGVCGQQLDGDLTIEPRVAGTIDLAHPAGPNRGDDFVDAKACPGRERQGCRVYAG
jgi:hypothetical protein